MIRLSSVPNLLTGFRFALIPLLIVLFSVEQSTKVELWSFVVFTIAAVTDFVDGWVARHYDIETVFGKLMDPLADKVLVTTVLVMLIPIGKVAAWVCLLIVCREIIITGFRGLAATTGKVVAAGSLGKLKSNFQYFGLGCLIFPVNFLPIPYLYQIGTVLIYIALFLGLWSGAVYAYNLRSVFLETTQ